ncbi:MAG TPA: hypothetical protein PLL10_02210 [Elusimicrobiales bacterium]|nr:hypothetical protein [Elusimicrobiales bacterium]
MKRAIIPAIAMLLCLPPASANAAPPKEITSIEFLHEVMWHLYRWYVDERDVDKLAGTAEVEFWVRELSAKLDAGDKSLFGEIIIPDLDVSVVVKKSDYSVEELGLQVKNARFKIVNVSRPSPKIMPDNCVRVKTNYRELKNYSHGKRALTRFPDEEITRLFQKSALEAINSYLQDRKPDGKKSAAADVKGLDPEGIIHLAALLEISNETWAFWEPGKLLLHFSSDTDIENPAAWKHGGVAVKPYNIAEQTVISLDEVAGSNAYMTRDQVGRILFNSIVLGRRLPLVYGAAVKEKHQ